MKKIIKNNRGFTLIELLITISILIAITAVAIVSFIGLSNRKKEESWNLVKKQVETAAKEYLSANEYIYNNPDQTNMRISVGKLVAEDYLNVVINPKDSNKLDYCDYVEVAKNNDKYGFSYRPKDSDNCDPDAIIYATANAPTATFFVNDTLSDKKTEAFNKSGATGWYNVESYKNANYDNAGSTQLPLYLIVKINNRSNIKITSVIYNGVNIIYNKVDGNSKILYYEMDDDGIIDSDLIIHSEADKVGANNVTMPSFKTNVKINKDTKNPEIIQNEVKQTENQNNKKIVDILGRSTDNIGLDKIILENNSYVKEWKAEEKNCKYIKDGYNQCEKDEKGEHYIVQNIWYDGYDLNNILSEDEDTYNQKLVAYDIAGNSSESTNSYETQKGCINTKIVSKEENIDCPCGGTQKRVWNEYLDVLTNELCSSDEPIIQGSCNKCNTDNTAPYITVTIYKRNKDGSNGKQLATKSGRGTDMSEGKNRIKVLNGLWLNGKNYPYGINISLKSNEKIAKGTWYVNKGGLTKTDATKNGNDWETGKAYPNGKSSDISNITSKTWDFSGEGSRRGRIYVKDSSGNETKFYIIVNMDRSKPTIVNFEGGRVTNCTNGIAWGYSIKYKDNLSGVILSSDGYYSDAYCKKWDWHPSAVTDSVSENSQMITTVFANCSNNPNPRYKYRLVDGAGNDAALKTVSANQKASKSSCKGSKWWNE